MAEGPKDGAIFMTREKLNWNKMGGLESELLIPGRVFPDEFPFDLDSPDSFHSSLSSAVVSVEDSTEPDSSEEDEDEFLAGLTRRLTQSSQKLAVPSLHQDRSKKSCMASSPQSTLSELGSWSVSSNGSPNGPSQAPSPPTTPFSAQKDTWDLISAAAGEIARLKVNSEPPKYRNDAVCNNRSLPYPQSEASLKNSSALLNTSEIANYSLLQSSQYHLQQRREQCLNRRCDVVWGTPARPSPAQQVQTKGRSFNCSGETGRCGRPGLPQASWTCLRVQSQNQPPQSTMRAVFLGGSGGVKRECAGTGVFLPRRCANPPESRKKSGCSTVLLPAKVVQALNLNLDEIGSRSQRQFNANLASSYDAIMARRNGVFNQQRRNYRSEGLLLNHGLPQDWTY